jgi:hypothetical protein
VFVDSKCTSQEDGVNCGVYAIENAKALLQEGPRTINLEHITINPALKRLQYFQVLYNRPYDSDEWEPLELAHGPTAMQASSPVEYRVFRSSNVEMDVSQNSGSTTAITQSTSTDDERVKELQRLIDFRRGFFDRTLGVEVLCLGAKALELLPSASCKLVGTATFRDQRIYAYNVYVDAIDRYLPRWL